MITKPDTLRASDKQRAALAQRLAKTMTAKDVFRPKPEPEPVPPAPKPELNAFEIAGRARRAAYRARTKRIQLLREKLVTQFPNCFKPAGESRLPLKIGIRQDIMGALPDVSRNDLKLTLSNYVRDKSYREAMIKGAMRVDLDGHPTTAITKEETRWPPQARTDS